jgi:hypothetical protein
VGVDEVTLITDRLTSRAADLFNASYGLAVQILCRFFVHESDRGDELRALADAAVGVMSQVVKPLGVALTSQPVGTRLPGVTAGPSFELQSREYLLPFRREAFIVLRERMRELAGHSASISQAAPEPLRGHFDGVRKSLLSLSDSLSLED